jgi:CBS domain-containing protein
MTSQTPTVPGGAHHLDPAGDRFRLTLRYLTAAARPRSGQVPESVPTGPEFVRDVMVTGVVAAHEEALFKEIVAALARNRISAVPVVDGQHRVIGVVSESDLLARVCGGHLALPRGHRLSGHAELRAKLHAATARELMTAPAVVTTPDMHIADAARLAADSHVRRLPVVDSAGVLIGIVTRADLLQPFLRPDAEIHEDIAKNVVVGSYVLDPRAVEIEVVEGVVTLRGQLERKSLRDGLVESVRGVGGVVDVDASGLSYLGDDSRPPLPGAPLY